MVPIGPPFVTSSYSTRIFYKDVSGFATDCPCGVWCLGLTTCLLYVCPLFRNRLLGNGWAVCLTYWIVNLHLYVFWHMQFYAYYIIWFFGLSLHLQQCFFIKYSCTNIFHRRSPYSFFQLYQFRWEWIIQQIVLDCLSENVCIFFLLECQW